MDWNKRNIFNLGCKYKKVSYILVYLLSLMHHFEYEHRRVNNIKTFQVSRERKRENFSRSKLSELNFMIPTTKHLFKCIFKKDKNLKWFRLLLFVTLTCTKYKRMREWRDNNYAHDTRFQSNQWLHTIRGIVP